MALILYELGGRDDRRYSLYSWRARMALAHKGLTPDYKPVHVSDKAAIAFSKQDKVPILVDGETRGAGFVSHRAASRGASWRAEPVRRRDRTGARTLLQFLGRPHAGAAPRAAGRARRSGHPRCGRRAPSARRDGEGVRQDARGARRQSRQGRDRLSPAARSGAREPAVAALHLRRAAGLSRLHPVQPVPVGAHRQRLRAARSRRRACRVARADARPARAASRARSRRVMPENDTLRDLVGRLRPRRPRSPARSRSPMGICTRRRFASLRVSARSD